MTASPAFITLENISKRFPGVLALDQINLTLNKGEVHCLAGQNGCGKSTIIKIISGVYQPEKGANISLEGKLFHALTPQLSGYYGIQVIYQDLSLFPNLTVAENIAIHRYLPGGHFWVRKRVMRQTALDAMALAPVDPDHPGRDGIYLGGSPHTGGIVQIGMLTAALDYVRDDEEDD